MKQYMLIYLNALQNKHTWTCIATYGWMNFYLLGMLNFCTISLVDRQEQFAFENCTATCTGSTSIGWSVDLQTVYT